jgi:hypothetical protein
MASPVTISNLALAHIGATQQVSAIDPPDGSVLAGYCARFYPIARREMLEYPWRFARRRSTLVLAPDAPPPGWMFAYALPATCLAPKRIVSPQPITVMPWLVDQEDYWLPRFDTGAGAEFEVENNLVLTNVPEAVLLHTVDVTDATKYTPAFVSALAQRLGGYLAGVAIKGREGANLRRALHDEATETFERAMTRDANAGQESRMQLPDSIAARR